MVKPCRSTISTALACLSCIVALSACGSHTAGESTSKDGLQTAVAAELDLTSPSTTTKDLQVAYDRFRADCSWTFAEFKEGIDAGQGLTPDLAKEERPVIVSFQAGRAGTVKLLSPTGTPIGTTHWVYQESIWMPVGEHHCPTG